MTILYVSPDLDLNQFHSLVTALNMLDYVSSLVTMHGKMTVCYV